MGLKNMFDEMFGEDGYTKISYDFENEEVVVEPAKESEEDEEESTKV